MNIMRIYFWQQSVLLIGFILLFSKCKENDLRQIQEAHRRFYFMHAGCLDVLADQIFAMNLKESKHYSMREVDSLINGFDSICGEDITLFKRPFNFINERNEQFIIFYPDLEDMKCTSVSLCVYKHVVDKANVVYLNSSQTWTINVEQASPCF
jgi:hypothetical protein